MHLSFATSNVLHQALNTQINIVYNPVSNLFDNILFLINEDYQFYILESLSIAYKHSNAKILPKHYIGLYNYNIALVNNPLQYVQNNTTQGFHINSLLFFHTNKPHNLKKEDRIIINNKLLKQTKIFFSYQDLQDWQLTDRTMVINYGIPLDHISYTTKCEHRAKDVLLVGDMRNMVNRSLYQALTEAGYSADIKELTVGSVDEASKLFNQYKIVIDLSNYARINCVSAVAAGCYGIHNSPHSFNTPSLIFTDSIESSILAVQNIISAYNKIDHETRVSSDRLLIGKDYNFLAFRQSIKNTIDHLSHKEAFKL